MSAPHLKTSVSNFSFPHSRDEGSELGTILTTKNIINWIVDATLDQLNAESWICWIFTASQVVQFHKSSACKKNPDLVTNIFVVVGDCACRFWEELEPSCGRMMLRSFWRCRLDFLQLSRFCNTWVAMVVDHDQLLKLRGNVPSNFLSNAIQHIL